MALDLEPIFVALTARLEEKVAALGKITRSEAEFQARVQSQYPVALLLGGTEDTDRRPGSPPRWTLRPALNVYTKTGSTPADVELNAIKFQIEAALERQEGETIADPFSTTLGVRGVKHCHVVAAERVHGPEEAEMRVEIEILAVQGA